jgi:hypothetical protein
LHYFYVIILFFSFITQDGTVMNARLLFLFLLASIPALCQTYSSVKTGDATEKNTWGESKDNFKCNGNQLSGNNYFINATHVVTFSCANYTTGWGTWTEVLSGGTAVYSSDFSIASGDGVHVGLKIQNTGFVRVDGNYTPNFGAVTELFAGGQMLVKKDATIPAGNDDRVTLRIGSNAVFMVDGNLQLDGRIHVASGGILFVKGNYTSNNGTITADPGAQIIIQGNVVLDGWNPITGIILNGDSRLEVGGNYASKNGFLNVGEGGSVLISGNLSLTGSERVAISLNGVDDFQVVGNTEVVESAKVEFIDSKPQFYGDFTTSGGPRTAVWVKEGSEVRIQGDYYSSGGITRVEQSDVEIDGKLLINNGGADVTIAASSTVLVNDGIDMTNSGKLNIGNSDLIVNGNVQLSGGGTAIVAGGGSEVEVNGNFSILSSARTFLINSNITIQSLEVTDADGNTTYLGGNVLVQGYGSKMEISDGSVLAILGNKNFGIGVDDPAVQGNLTLQNGGELEVQHFGKILIYHNVTRIDSNGNPVTTRLFFTQWWPSELPQPVPLFVILGGVSCDEWWGPPGTCRDGDATLPVELLSFEATTADREVLLGWQTASELNNDFFTVERSTDGINFEAIGKVSGNGSTREAKSYTFRDRAPLPGMGYYRLSQTDYDGTHEILGVRAVNFIPGDAGLSVYPNPLHDGVLTLRVGGLEAGRDALIRIFDPAGRIVYQEQAPAEQGFLQRELDLSGLLDRGVYMLNVIQGNSRFAERIVKL